MSYIQVIRIAQIYFSLKKVFYLKTGANLYDEAIPKITVNKNNNNNK